MQLIKDFTAERAHNEVEFYMGMVVQKISKLLKALYNTLRMLFSLVNPSMS